MWVEAEVIFDFAQEVLAEAGPAVVGVPRGRWHPSRHHGYHGRQPYPELMADVRGLVSGVAIGVAGVSAALMGVLATRVKTSLLDNSWFVACLVITIVAVAVAVGIGLASVWTSWRSRRLPSPAQTPAGPAPAVTNHWRDSLNGLSTTLTQLQHNSISHPAYQQRDLNKRHPSLRFAVVISCDDLDLQAPDTGDIRARFLALLAQPTIMEFLQKLVEMDSLAWRSRDDNPPLQLRCGADHW